MSATVTPNQSIDESRPLLDGGDQNESHQPGNYYGPPNWVDLSRHAYEVSREALPGYACLLLGFVPIGIVVGALQLNSVATSILNFFAIIPLSALVSYSSDLLSNHVGELVGGLINATFGNAVELIVGILALSHGKRFFAQTMMIGSILSDILLVLGCCLFIAAFGKSTIKFKTAIADALSSLMIITAVSLILPTALYSTFPPSSRTDISGKVLTFSRGSAGVLLILYLLYLYFQLMTHPYLFSDGDQDEVSTEEQRTNSDDGTSESASAGHLLVTVITLIVATACIMICTHFLIDNVDDAAKTVYITNRFVAAILMPIASNAPEFAAVLFTARNGRTSYALGVIVGSILQIALLVIPFLVILGWIIQQPMTLYFEPFQTMVLFFAVLLFTRILRDGEYTYLHGVMLIELYAVVALSFFIRQDPKLKSDEPLL